MLALPVCWCGDPGTYALPVDAWGVGDLEPRWEVEGREVVMRCRSHAGPFGVEVVDDDALRAITPVPIDAQPWDVALPLEP